ncbi:iron dicitrate transport regulator FecR [Niastella koreensis]|uniref:Anti-FecI sigma factor, FecR n=2 Tax=Niastella koreensis TaxID=354356 RepID=G8TAJ0_NIAKG|nr:FecR family protein [Niastella koreensis]AEV98152.1 anti-FecI sigma factor, FecR [Niastella koreensis GR20-10]OQP45358.1 iron dicitrate transport regulator FecR [Niastella koreensis]
MNKPEQSIITSLLEKHALGICTPEEMVLLEQWYAAFPEQGKVWNSAEEKAAMKDSLKADIFNAIAPAKVTAFTEVPAKPSRSRWWQAAAAVLILMGSYLVYNKYTNKKEPETIVVSAAAGKGILQYELPDHSFIWLEPGTTVRYRKHFVNETREIELADGMAFFSVTKDRQHPFLVKTRPGVQTSVLGTEFTVKAYAQSANVQVMVKSGIVQVADGTRILDTLKASQQLSYQLKEHTCTRMEGLQEDWRSGDIALLQAPFTEVARILEKRYGLQVVYNAKEAEAYSFTLHLGKQATASDMLEMLKDISGLQYELNNNKVTIHK